MTDADDPGTGRPCNGSIFTTSTTRKVGLGVPFLSMLPRAPAGALPSNRNPGVGTTVTAVFGLSHIDRMPLGDMNATIHTLLSMPSGYGFSIHTAITMRHLSWIPEISGDFGTSLLIHLRYPPTSNEYLTENKLETDGGAYHRPAKGIGGIT